MNQNAYIEILDTFLSCMEFLARPTLYSILYGYNDCESPRQADLLVERLEERQFVARTGRGKRAIYSITANGLRQASALSPMRHWETPWDGHWRAVLFDLPANRPGVRQALWKALRARKFGLLQRSVWVWPHECEAILKEITDARGVPECFCGLESRRLFLCTDEEVIETAWKFDDIGEHHTSYLESTKRLATALNKVKDMESLGRLARVEREAFRAAFAWDPLLPRRLCPKGYRGFQVERRHQEILQTLRNRMANLGNM